MNKKPYFTTIVAFSTPSGRLHIGHALGQVVGDVASRYAELNGQEPFSPFGIHATGKDLLRILTEISPEHQNYLERRRVYGISNENAKNILSANSNEKRVSQLIAHYRDNYTAGLKSLGVHVNEDSFFSTDEKSFQKYTQWTLKKLAEKGLITETETDRPYCSLCDDIKHIDKDLSEVSAVGKIEWDRVRVEENQIVGGNFECRLHSGEKIIVRRSKERAINYGDMTMQQKTIDAVEKMNIFPPKYKSDLEKIIKTRLAKPFERKANENIGSISPFDATKKVEALSDSNIYMEFYAISQMLNLGELKSENLNDAFFDYVYLGRGDQKIVSRDSGIDETTLKKVRDQIEQKYPIALNVAGSEHKEVHFPFSLFTHSAVLPNSFFPREYISTAHVTLNGEKMSKSKGNVLYLDDVVEFVQESSVPSISKEASLDAIRYFLMSYQALDKDLDWSEKEFVNSGLNRFKKYVNFVNNTLSGNNTDFGLSTPKDKWFSTKVQRTIQDVTDSMETRKFREATLLIDDLSKNIMRYKSFPNSQSGFVNSAIETELTLMYPFTPRLSRELANQFLGKSIQAMPLFNLEYVFPEEHDQLEHELSGEKYVESLTGSLKRSLNIAKGKNLSRDNTFKILFPSEYSLELVKHKPLLAELLQGHSLSVNKLVRFPTIESSYKMSTLN